MKLVDLCLLFLVQIQLRQDTHSDSAAFISAPAFGLHSFALHSLAFGTLTFTPQSLAFGASALSLSPLTFGSFPLPLQTFAFSGFIIAWSHPFLSYLLQLCQLIFRQYRSYLLHTILPDFCDFGLLGGGEIGIALPGILSLQRGRQCGDQT
ncbi:MAG: hypothetical protein BWY71_00753 [Planctomycetes bacterium ADurb.Bin412]|nr:MAG: hypothetical protein BWY71_00753 [Planctomycetes bacterium ADurb.Bin412]